MLPREIRLLNGAREALARIQADAAPAAKATLDAVDAVLTELLLRTDRAFYIAHYAEGRSLCRTGATLAEELGGGDIPVELDRLPPACDPEAGTEDAWEQIIALRQVLVEAVHALSAAELQTDEKAKQWLAEIVAWENRFYSRHLSVPAALKPGEAANPYTRENVEGYLRRKFPDWKNLRVHAVKALPGGFSKKTVLLDITDDSHGARSLVIRAEQPPRFEFWDGDQVKNEFIVLQLMHEAGLPVAEPLWLETNPSHLGQHFLVSRKAEGQNVGSSIGVKDPIAPEMLEDLIRNLVRIHNTRINPNDPRILGSHLKEWAAHKTLFESTSAWIAHWLDCIRIKQLRPSPLTVRLMEWLRHNVPRTEEAPSLLHGDFGLHNALFTGNKVSCILDWEYTMFGDPAEDIALLSISLGGMMDKQHIMEIYIRCGGRPISEYRLRYFDVLYSMKFIVPCENGLKLFEEHEEASIGLCKWGFHYTYAGVGNLNEKIALAEEAQDKDF